MKIENHLNTTVHRAKLILLDKLNLEVYATQGDLAKSDRTGELYIHGGGVLSSKKMYPFIISETEKIVKGDKVLDLLHLRVSDTTYDERLISHWNQDPNRFYRILACPKHFSKEHLQLIVDKEILDYGEAFIKIQKCDYKSYRSSCGGDGWLSKDHGQASETCPKCNGTGHFISLDKFNYITLFPIQQPIEQAAKEYLKETPSSGYDTQMRTDTYSAGQVERAFKEGAKWAKNNYY